MFASSWPAGAAPVGELPGKSDAQPCAWGQASDRSTKDDDSDAQVHALTHLVSGGGGTVPSMSPDAQLHALTHLASGGWGVALSSACPLPIPYSSAGSLWFTCPLFRHPEASSDSGGTGPPACLWGSSRDQVAHSQVWSGRRDSDFF